MKTFCKIEGGVVVNRAVGCPDDGGVWIASEEAQIGWGHDGARFIAPPSPPPPPPPLVEAKAAVTVDRIAILEQALIDKGILVKADVTKAETAVRARAIP